MCESKIGNYIVIVKSNEQGRLIQDSLAGKKFYPIRLTEIEKRVAKKNGNRNSLNHRNSVSQLTLSNDVAESTGNIREIINEFGERIIRVDGDIPVDLPIKTNDRFLFLSYDQTVLTHGLHKYPAKFFPELPRWLIKRYSSEGETVLDPFSGSGTTNVEALLNRRHSVGIDVDPFSRYLSEVKVTPLDEEELRYYQKCLIQQVVDYHKYNVLPQDIPSFPYRDNWFNNETILELTYLRKIISLLDASNMIKDFFRICFSSILRAVSNADNNCTRTVIRKRLNKKVYPAEALERFVETILVNIPKAIEFSRVCPKDVIAEFPTDNDARNIKFTDNYFDLAITSPPYANAVDYPRTHQLEIYWLGFEVGSLTPLKKKHIGTESVSIEDYKVLHKIGITSADVTIAKIFKKDPRRAYIAYKYLYDMRKNLSEVYRVLKQGRRYIIVIGNNHIRGEVFENWKYIIEMAEDVGFRVETYFGSEIIKHFIKVPREERINTDWIVILQK